MTKEFLARNVTIVALIIILCALSSTATSAFSRSGHMVLLTVAEPTVGDANETGGTADVYLDIKPGSGRIFIDSYPLTKIDTQSSTRYANRVACSFLDVDCGKYDFFYTIRADSPVVGGPSAGAPIAVLTAALLKGEKVDESIAMTGTINAGGIIGPVAGIKAKALAAKERGIQLVLISSLSSPTEVNESYLDWLNASRADGENVTLNLSKLYTPLDTSALNITVREVSTLEEALALFTGKRFVETAPVIEEDEEYARIMRQVGEELCARRDGLAQYVNASELSRNEPTGNESVVARRDAARSRGDWYGAASYCFGDLVRLRGLAFGEKTQYERKIAYTTLVRDVKRMADELDARELGTMAELETYVIVAERLREAGETLAEMNLSNISATDLGFAFERHHSAEAWSAFFTMESPTITLDEERLGAACNEKISDAEERFSYLELYLPDEHLEGARELLTTARVDAREGRHALCLFDASKAQARVDLLAMTLGVPTEKVDALVRTQLTAAAGAIARQESRGRFPILGYSYYRYAASLSSHDEYSALTFAGESAELSNLDWYFPKEGSRRARAEPATYWILAVFACGILLGAALGGIIAFRACSKTGVKSGEGRQTSTSHTTTHSPRTKRRTKKN